MSESNRSPAAAELRQLEIWLTPHGFVKAAMAGNPTAVSRREYGERVTVVSFEALGKYRVNGTINAQNLIVRVQTWMPSPVVGDMYYETVYSDYRDFGDVKFPTRFHQHQDHDDNERKPNVSGGDHSFGLVVSDVQTDDKCSNLIVVQTWMPSPVVGDMYYETVYSDYRDFGDVKFPTRFHQHQDHDDNERKPNVSGGDHSFGLVVSDVQTNASGAALAVPATVREATVPPVRVESEKLADGVWYLGGSSHNSVAVEFRDYSVVIEAPLNEQRSLAVIEEVQKLIPNKPTSFVVNTHHHWDHLGGVRAYVHEGATIITHEGNRAYYEEIVTERQWILEPDRLSLYPPEEVAEGYTFETLREKYVLSDGERTMDIYRMQGLAHSAGMLIAYLPKEKIVVEADLYSPRGAQARATKNPSSVTFYENIKRLKLDIESIVPVHGRIVPMSDFVRFISEAR